MDFPDADSLAIKTEPVADEGEMLYIDVGFPDTTEDCPQYSQNINRISMPQTMDHTTKLNTENQKKRKRNKNWDDCEKVLLKRCIKESLQVVENKRSDTNALFAKRKAWKSILLKFNTYNDRQRDLRQIQMQWKTMKLMAKASRSRSVRETTSPGDETKAADRLRYDHPLKEEPANEFSGIFKSQTEYTHTPRLKETSEKPLSHTTPKEEIASSSRISNGPTPAHHSPKIQIEVVQDMSSSEDDNSPPHAAETRPSTRSSSTKKSKASTDNKLKVMIYQETKKILHKEHEKRIQHMEEESQTKIRLMEEENKLKLTLLRELHEEQIRKLKEKKAE